MAEIGALHAALSANAAQFEQDMGRARRAVSNSATSMQTSMQRARQGFNDAMRAMKLMAVAAVGGAVALGNMVRKQLEAADQATKTAQSVGVAVETLTAWNHAANLSGVSQENLANAFKITAQRAAEAARGSGEAARAYKLLDIDVQNADKSLKASDQLMLEVADKFSKMEDGAGKTALAVQLFGRSGADLIPMLNRGRAGITEMTDEAARLGLVFDTETGQAAERFRDNITRLQAVKTGYVNQITRSVLPTLEAYTDRMVKASQETEGMAKAGDAANAALKLLLSTGTLLKVAFDAVGSALGGVAAIWWAIARGQFSEAWAIAGEASDDFLIKMKAAGEDLSAIWNETTDGMARSAKGQGEKMAAPVTEAVSQIDRELERLQNRIDGQIKALEMQAATLGMTRKEMTLYRLETEGATQAQLAAATAALASIEAYEDEQAALQRIRQEWQDLQAEQAGIDSQAERILESLRTEEQVLQDSYDKRREIILQSTILAEEEKNAVILDLARQRDEQLAQLDAMRTSVMLQNYGSMFGAMADITGEFAGKQSSLYRTMFAASKAFALADAIVKIQQGIANAASLPFPANLAAMASVAASTAGIVSTIASTQPSFEGGGFTGYGARFGGVDGRGGFPAILHPNESVIDHNQGVGSGVNLRIVNVLDPKIVESWANSASGERVIMNIVSRNKQVLT